jgi:hypothetical protein
MRVALKLAGGPEALVPGKRLRLRRVQVVCDALRDRYHLSNPLAEALLHQDGARIVAQVSGIRFEPVTGQLRLALNEIEHELHLLASVKNRRTQCVASLREEAPQMVRDSARPLLKTKLLIDICEEAARLQLSQVGERQ